MSDARWWGLASNLRLSYDEKDFSAERPWPTFNAPTVAPITREEILSCEVRAKAILRVPFGARGPEARPAAGSY